MVKIPLMMTTDAIPVVVMLNDNVESLEVRTKILDDAFIRITG